MSYSVVFYVVKWVTWHCTLPWMPASKQKKILLDTSLRVISDILWSSCFESYGQKDIR